MTNSIEELSRYQTFVDRAVGNFLDYEKKMKGNGSFQYSDQVIELFQLSNKMNKNLLVYLFGEQLGHHLAEKFVVECHRNLLAFFNCIDSQYSFFILHELKNNKHLFAYC